MKDVEVITRSFYQRPLLRATMKYVGIVASSCVHFTSMDSSSGSGANWDRSEILSLSQYSYDIQLFNHFSNDV